VRAIVTGMLDDTLATRLTADALALRAAGAGDAWLRMRRPGDTVDIRIAVVSASRGAPATEAVGGFPLLVRAGRNVVAEQAGIVATFGPARHPRTAVGWSADPPRLFWVVVDGRQAGYSAGMTLDELAALMLRLGAREALNLDGGGSSALVVRGMVRNRPSDATGERAVGNALALERCG
jgi:exopolysaccharide biosynthesis protein